MGTAVPVRDCGTFGAGAKLYLILVLFRYLVRDLHRIDLHSKVPPPGFGRVEVARNDKSKFVGLILASYIIVLNSLVTIRALQIYL